MEIQTDFDIGQQVYILNAFCNEIKTDHVQTIKIDENGILYIFAICNNVRQGQNRVFATRREAENMAIKEFAQRIREVSNEQ